ncbi:MAG: tetratricopeptide (TPR) repeat protein [Verrucomicrobiales bacterium]|jgi:tetratricopeptide (TPR) repeat protein
MWRQVVAQSPGDNALDGEVLRYDLGWKALNTMLKAGRSLSGHERNCAFLNTGGDKRFADISAAAGIDFDDDGRVIALTDWDQDGDLDFWIANRTGPQARFVRNNSDPANHWIQFKLKATAGNRDAIGARIELQLEGAKAPLARTVRSGGGYLSQASKWLHFAFGKTTPDIATIQVYWPDGKKESFPSLASKERYVLTQGTGSAIPAVARSNRVTFTDEPTEPPTPASSTRIVLITPPPIPSIMYQDVQGAEHTVTSGYNKARLVTLWASWCTPCLAELKEWGQHAADFSKRSIDVLALNIEDLSERETMDKTYAKLAVPFKMGYGTESAASQFDVLQRAVLSRQRPLPLPSSFLIDGEGNLRVIYKGPVSAAQIIADAELIGEPLDKILASAVPYPGKWLGQPAGASPNSIAVRFVEGGYIKEAEEYLRQLTNENYSHPTLSPGDAFVLLGAILLDRNRLEESAEAFKKALHIAPHHRQSQIELAGVLTRLKRSKEAIKYYQKALSIRQNDPTVHFRIGMLLIELGEVAAAIPALETSVGLRPSPLAHFNLGNALLAVGKVSPAIEQFEAAVKLSPDSFPASNNLAWLRASHPEAGLRNPQQALQLAERICAHPDGRTSSHLDTLAVAYAANGNYPKAIETADESIRLAKAVGDLASMKEVQSRLELYRKDQPFIDQ